MYRTKKIIIFKLLFLKIRLLFQCCLIIQHVMCTVSVQHRGKEQNLFTNLLFLNLYEFSNSGKIFRYSVKTQGN